VQCTGWCQGRRLRCCRASGSRSCPWSILAVCFTAADVLLPLTQLLQVLPLVLVLPLTRRRARRLAGRPGCPDGATCEAGRARRDRTGEEAVFGGADEDTADGEDATGDGEDATGDGEDATGDEEDATGDGDTDGEGSEDWDAPAWDPG
jgi:hypothetical protein